MGVQFPPRAAVRARRVVLTLFVGASLLLLGACSEADRTNIRNLAYPGENPRGATDRSVYMFDLWKWSWVAAMIVGVIVWGLIFYSVIRFRRRSADDVPVQTRYNLPLEVFYTFVPILMVVVFFVQTVRVQDAVLEPVKNPDVTVDVVGQQWSWTFNYRDEDVAQGKNVYDFGTASRIPKLVLPVDESVRFNLHSPDVIHSFWITGFLMKTDVIPGRTNVMYLTPKEEGTFRGKCAELCGFQHSRMIFDVEVVSREEYDRYLQDQMDAGFVSDEAVRGNRYTRTTVGLESGHQDGGSH